MGFLTAKDAETAAAYAQRYARIDAETLAANPRCLACGGENAVDNGAIYCPSCENDGALVSFLIEKDGRAY